jgi:hypothetical protein
VPVRKDDEVQVARGTYKVSVDPLELHAALPPLAAAARWLSSRNEIIGRATKHVVCEGDVIECMAALRSSQNVGSCAAAQSSCAAGVIWWACTKARQRGVLRHVALAPCVLPRARSLGHAGHAPDGAVSGTVCQGREGKVVAVYRRKWVIHVERITREKARFQPAVHPSVYTLDIASRICTWTDRRDSAQSGGR